MASVFTGLNYTVTHNLIASFLKNIMLFPIEGNQSFATPKYAFWDTDFKLVIKKQKTQTEFSPFPFTCLKEFR